MKTNQMMEVKIGEYGSITIGHKDKMGRVQDVINMANMSAKMKGGEGGYVIDQALRSVDLWKYILEVEAIRLNNPSKSVLFNPTKSITSNSVESTQLSNPLLFNNNKVMANYNSLKEHTDKSGNVNYKPLMKMFPHLIKSKRGRYGGTWAHLEILLKIAGNTDKAVEAMAYHILSERQILQHRDAGGNSFKELNKAIDTLPDRSPLLKPKGNRGCYINMAILMRKKLEIAGRGYNNTDHDELVQKERARLEDGLVMMIKVGVITSYNELKLMLVKL